MGTSESSRAYIPIDESRGLTRILIIMSSLIAVYTSMPLWLQEQLFVLTAVIVFAAYYLYDRARHPKQH
jgi:uncharacterized membrane protein SirB2